MPSYTDKELIGLCIQRDETAWGVFVDRFSLLIRHSIREKLYFSRFPLSNTDIDDIYQDVFKKIWHANSLKSLRSPKSLKSFLVIIAQNTTSLYFRKKNKHLKFLNASFDIESAPLKVSPRSLAQEKQLEQIINDFIDSLLLRE